ncbi:tripartite motif-containing protein 59-like [Strongylocentrotus purpuratus]|uniref:Uncharacterized protein n=1 Tax=Strongylocentrotus purpuratus TaxID=7668 RepID=A0A7M7SYL3_STRPU|nr:tripartite motif-containing protein 59-like [Strongylocentrotus purpuratus]
MKRKRKVSSHPDVTEHLICAICTDIFHDPRILVCGHVFCKNCLDRLMRKRVGFLQFLTISCPTCRHDTELTESGVNGLSRIIPIVGILDQDLSEEPGPSCKRSKRIATCSEHNQEQRVIYCSTCQDMICFKCFQENHSNHVIKTRNEFLGELSQKAQDAKQKYQVQLKTVENNLREADQAEQLLHSEHTRAKQLIENEYKAKLARLSNTMKQRKSDYAKFKVKGEQFKTSLAIAVPKLESKTLLEDLDDDGLKSYVENVDNVTNLLQTDIGVKHLNHWNKSYATAASSRPQFDSVPSTSGGTAEHAFQIGTLTSRSKVINTVFGAPR